MISGSASLPVQLFQVLRCNLAKRNSLSAYEYIVVLIVINDDNIRDKNMSESRSQ